MPDIIMTQYLLPDGRKRHTYMPAPDAVFAKAQSIMDAGMRFEAEVLNTGDVSTTITHPDYGDLDITIHANGPGLHEAIHAMIERFDLSKSWDEEGEDVDQEDNNPNC